MKKGEEYIEELNIKECYQQRPLFLRVQMKK